VGGSLAAAIVALTMGHVFSNAVRTLPAVAADVLQRDLAISADGLAALTGAFPAAFALAMIPVGVALDRYGVKPVSLSLLLVGAAGSAFAALAPGVATMLAAQVVLGIGCSGMLMCPITFAAKRLPPARFGLWSGLILALGNVGMLLSASPLALLVDAAGWRAGFWVCAAGALAAAIAVALIVREAPPEGGRDRTVWSDTREVLALIRSPSLRGLLVVAFASFAAILGLRGLWGGPWLMEIKGLSRVAAGNALLACTVALTLGPAINGMLERRFPRHRRALLAAGHFVAAAIILLIVAGGALGFPPELDAVLLTAFGFAISTQALCFALVRAAVPPDQAGRALSAQNLSFFGGAAVMQGVSGLAAAVGGTAAAMASFAIALVLCTVLYLRLPGPR